MQECQQKQTATIKANQYNLENEELNIKRENKNWFKIQDRYHPLWLKLKRMDDQLKYLYMLWICMILKRCY